MLWAVAVAVAVSCLLILPNMSEENAAGECAGDWFASPHGAYFWCMGFMKTWMFSLSGPWMALKRPQASEPVHRAIV